MRVVISLRSSGYVSLRFGRNDVRDQGMLLKVSDKRTQRGFGGSAIDGKRCAQLVDDLRFRAAALEPIPRHRCRLIQTIVVLGTEMQKHDFVLQFGGEDILRYGPAKLHVSAQW